MMLLKFSLLLLSGVFLIASLVQNSVIGYRTKQTLNNPILWRKANILMGLCLLAFGVILTIYNGRLTFKVTLIAQGVALVISVVVTEIMMKLWLSKTKKN
jgi:uncharacterized membrane protein